jgi:riboflavin synthase
MFTGLIEQQGTIESLQKLDGLLRAQIRANLEHVVPGESISIDGVCLTAVEPEAGSEPRFWVEISEETLDRTTMKFLERGQKVNLERALRVGDRMGGHWVSGHIDTIGKVLSVEHSSRQPALPNAPRTIRIGEIDARFRSLRLEKGSIAVNGTSLTINGTTDTAFWFLCIPHTLEKTNLENLAPGMWVNLEFDWMVKTVMAAAEREGGILGFNRAR